jgi:hypothetical protein
MPIILLLACLVLFFRQQVMMETFETNNDTNIVLGFLARQSAPTIGSHHDYM